LGDDVQIYPPPDAGTQSAIQINKEDFVLAPRASLRTQSQFMPNASARALTANANGGTVFKSNTPSESAPQLVHFGENKALMVWVDDDAARTDANASALMYSVYNGSVWSAPAQVYDDGTTDFAPVLASDGNGAYLVWQNLTEEAGDGVTLDDMLKLSDLYCAKFDGAAFGDVTNLNAAGNEVYETGHKIAADDGTLSVVWIENSENDFFLMDGTNSIKRKTLTGGAWQNAETLAADLPVITSIDAAYIDGENLVAFSQGLAAQSEVYEINGGVKRRLSNNAIPDTGVQYAGGALYWTAGNTIKNLDVTVGAGAMRDMKILVSGGEAAVVFDKADGFNSELYAIYYDSANGFWGEPVKITGAGGHIRQFSAVLKPDGGLDVVFNRAEVLDPEETGEVYGQCDLMFQNIARRCDLETLEAGYDASEVAPNADVTFWVRLRNNGAKPIERLSLSLSANGSVLAGEEMDYYIAAGETTEIEFSYHLPATLANQTLTASASPVGATDENLLNNGVSLDFACADVAVAEVRAAQSGAVRTIQADIQNAGYKNLSDIIVKLYDARDGETCFAQTTLNALTVGGTQTVSFNVSAYDCDFYRVCAELQESELRYANNSNTAAFESAEKPPLNVAFCKYTLAERLNAETTYVNNTGQTAVFTAYVALYGEGGRLADVYSEAVSVPPNDAYTVYSDFAPAESGELRAFAWQDGITPVTGKAAAVIQ
jgi:hypothetical protein